MYDKEYLKQLFKNNSNCYADTHDFDNNNNFIEGEVIMAITEDVFIDLVMKLFPE